MLWKILVPVHHSISVEGVVYVRGRPAPDVGSDAVEGAAGQGQRHPRPLHLPQLNVGQLGVDGDPVPGHVAASEQNMISYINQKNYFLRFWKFFKHTSNLKF